jgi:hypothetical protein
MSATEKAFALLEKREGPEVEVLRFLFHPDGWPQLPKGLPADQLQDFAEDLAARYIVALAVAQGYGDKQLDADLAAALEEARKRQS